MLICCFIFTQLNILIICLCHTETLFLNRSLHLENFACHKQMKTLDFFFFQSGVTNRQNGFHVVLKTTSAVKKLLVARRRIRVGKTFTHATHKGTLSVYLT